MQILLLQIHTYIQILIEPGETFFPINSVDATLNIAIILNTQMYDNTMMTLAPLESNITPWESCNRTRNKTHNCKSFSGGACNAGESRENFNLPNDKLIIFHLYYFQVNICFLMVILLVCRQVITHPSSYIQF